MKYGKILAAGLVLVALVTVASSAMAQSPLIDTTPGNYGGSGNGYWRTGGMWLSGGYGGSPKMGYMVPPPGNFLGSIIGVGWGFAYDQVTEVSSFTFKPDPKGEADGRWLVKELEVYANGKSVGTIYLEDTWAEKEYLIYNSAGQQIAVTANWVTLVPRAWYVKSSGYFPVTEFYFNGTAKGPAETSIHLDRALVDPGKVKYETSGLYNNGAGMSGAKMVDGILASSADTDSVFWDYNSADTTGKWLTVYYDTEDNVGVTVQSVGISLFANNDGRFAPKWVKITGSDVNGPEAIVWLGRVENMYSSITDKDEQERYARFYGFYLPNGELDEEKAFADHIDGVLTQYDRYDLVDKDGNPVIFSNITSLTITFPAPNDTGAWWGTGSYYGVTEFQAFTLPTPTEVGIRVIPEPATMTLLALGGLALLRRRKSSQA